MFTKKKKSLDSQFLVRVIKNEVSPEEKEYFLAWLSESNQNREEFGNLVLLWDMADQSKVQSIPDAADQWAGIQKIISRQSETVPKFIPFKTNKNSSVSVVNRQISINKKDYSWLLRAAAIVILSIGISYLIKFGKNTPNSQPVEIVEQLNPTVYELETQKGERKTFPLSDGTIVYLNSGSKLIYPKIFSESAREVEIIGEAYFTVTPDKEKPFIVKSGKMVTQVTGTEFNVRYRNNMVNVVVAKGSVKTFTVNSNSGIALSKGQMISFTEKQGFSSPRKVNLNNYLAWRFNKFSFEHTPLKDVMDEIERYYNVNVVFADESAKDKVLTGMFDTDSIDQILSVISLTLDINIEYKGSVISIK